MSPFLLLIMFNMLFSDAKVENLADLKWEKRIVLYFNEDGASDPVFLDKSIQKRIKERDIAYFIFSEDLHANVEHQFSTAYRQKLKTQYGKDIQPRWVLIGKDGGVKLAKDEKIDFELIFSTIDQMPMRIREMKDGQRSSF